MDQFQQKVIKILLELQSCINELDCRTTDSSFCGPGIADHIYDLITDLEISDGKDLCNQ